MFSPDPEPGLLPPLFLMLLLGSATVALPVRSIRARIVRAKQAESWLAGALVERVVDSWLG